MTAEAVTDKEILGQRRTYLARLEPFAREVIKEDGYLQEALGSLNDYQSDVLVKIFADHVGVERFGRTVRERPYAIHRKDGSSQTMDPVKNRYSRKLHEAGIRDSSEYLSMLSHVGDEIRIATNMDPFFENP